MRLIYIAIMLSFSTFIMSGCEGGKSKTITCAPGESAGPYNNCTAPDNSCPPGQSWVNGRCQTVKPQCPEGQNLQDNQCVIDTQNCPLGQYEQNGECVNIPLNCRDGYHEQNGVCVENTVNCDNGQVAVNGECVDNVLSVTAVNEHTCRIESNGVTRVTLEYVVRDAYGNTVSPENPLTGSDALTTQLYIDGRPLDVESKVTQSSVVLNSDLALSLVLDGSYSMLRHEPPAFEPMKNAATSILRETQSIWNDNEANFHWELSWFDTLIYRPAPNNADEPWTIQDIADIPAPEDAVTPTALRKAIASMTDVHQALYQQEVATGERDQHVMIVLSDGADNNSEAKQRDVADPLRSDEENLLFWEAISYPPTTSTDLQEGFSAVPNLKVFVIGFGDGVNKQELQEIAQWGNGRYFYGENTANLGALFNAVQREFVTQLKLEAEVPLPEDNYVFTLEARIPGTEISGQLNFSKSVSNTALPACTL